MASFLDRFVGQSVEILLESRGAGRTGQFAEVRLPEAEAADHVPGRLTWARVTGSTGRALVGEALT